MGRDKDMFASSTYTNKVWVTVGIIAFVVVMMLIFYYTLLHTQYFSAIIIGFINCNVLSYFVG